MDVIAECADWAVAAERRIANTRSTPITRMAAAIQFGSLASSASRTNSPFNVAGYSSSRYRGTSSPSGVVVQPVSRQRCAQS